MTAPIDLRDSQRNRIVIGNNTGREMPADAVAIGQVAIPQLAQIPPAAAGPVTSLPQVFAPNMYQFISDSNLSPGKSLMLLMIAVIGEKAIDLPVQIKPQWFFPWLHQYKEQINIDELITILSLIHHLNETGKFLDLTRQDADTLYFLAGRLCLQGTKNPYTPGTLLFINSLWERCLPHVSPPAKTSFFHCLLGCAVKEPQSMGVPILSLLVNLVSLSPINGLTPFQTAQLAKIFLCNPAVAEEVKPPASVVIPGLCANLLTVGEFSDGMRLKLCHVWRKADTLTSRESRDRLVTLLKSAVTESLTVPGKIPQISNGVDTFACLMERPEPGEIEVIGQILNRIGLVGNSNEKTQVMNFVLPLFKTLSIPRLRLLEEPLICLFEEEVCDPGCKIINHLQTYLPDSCLLQKVNKKLADSLASIREANKTPEEKIADAFLIAGQSISLFPDSANRDLVVKTFNALCESLYSQKKSSDTLKLNELASMLLSWFARPGCSPNSEQILSLMRGLALFVRSEQIDNIGASLQAILQKFAELLQQEDSEIPQWAISDILKHLNEIDQSRVLPQNKPSSDSWIRVFMRQMAEGEYDLWESQEALIALGELTNKYPLLLQLCDWEDLGAFLRKCREDLGKYDSIDNPSKFLSALACFLRSGLIPEKEVYLWKRICRKAILQTFQAGTNLETDVSLLLFISEFPAFLKKEDPEGFTWPENAARALTQKEEVLFASCYATLNSKVFHPIRRRQTGLPSPFPKGATPQRP